MFSPKLRLTTASLVTVLLSACSQENIMASKNHLESASPDEAQMAASFKMTKGAANNVNGTGGTQVAASKNIPTLSAATPFAAPKFALARGRQLDSAVFRVIRVAHEKDGPWIVVSSSYVTGTVLTLAQHQYVVDAIRVPSFKGHRVITVYPDKRMSTETNGKTTWSTFTASITNRKEVVEYRKEFRARVAERKEVHIPTVGVAYWIPNN